jgi:hypothetical protein
MTDEEKPSKPPLLPPPQEDDPGILIRTFQPKPESSPVREPLEKKG